MNLRFYFFLILLLTQSLSAKEKASDPGFLIIGCMKSGTTQLCHFLSQHPNIAINKRETRFFGQEFSRGRDWYLNQLAHTKEETLITGEKCPSYIYSTQAPMRIFSMYPNMKLILLLRNPVDRSYSQYQMKVRHNKESLSFEEAIAVEQNENAVPIESRVPPAFPYINSSVYIDHINRWLSIFPKNQLLVIFNEDLKSKPWVTLERVCTFLNIPSFQTMPRENASLIQKYPPIDPSTQARLTAFFEPYDDQLEHLLGPLPWRQPKE